MTGFSSQGKVGCGQPDGCLVGRNPRESVVGHGLNPNPIAIKKLPSCSSFQLPAVIGQIINTFSVPQKLGRPPVHIRWPWLCFCCENELSPWEFADTGVRQERTWGLHVVHEFIQGLGLPLLSEKLPSSYKRLPLGN